MGLLIVRTAIEYLTVGSGISQRAAAARSQVTWRWLVEPQASSLTAGEG